MSDTQERDKYGLNETLRSKVERVAAEADCVPNWHEFHPDDVTARCAVAVFAAYRARIDELTAERDEAIMWREEWKELATELDYVTVEKLKDELASVKADLAAARRNFELAFCEGWEAGHGGADPLQVYRAWLASFARKWLKSKQPAARADARRWIPTAEGVPEEGDDVLVTIQTGTDRRVITAYRDEGTWFDSSGEGTIPTPVAWQPLPEPYATKKERSDGE